MNITPKKNLQNIGGEEYQYFKDGITYKEFQELEKQRVEEGINRKEEKNSNKSLSKVLSSNPHEFYSTTQNLKRTELKKEIHTKLSPKEFWRKHGWSEPQKKLIYFQSDHSKTIKEDRNHAKRTTRSITHNPHYGDISTYNTIDSSGNIFTVSERETNPFIIKEETIIDPFYLNHRNHNYNEQNTFQGMSSSKKLSNSEMVTAMAGTLTNSYEQQEGLIGIDYKKKALMHTFDNGNTASFSVGGSIGVIPNKQISEEFHDKRNGVVMDDQYGDTIKGSLNIHAPEELPAVFIGSQINQSDSSAERTYHLVRNIPYTDKKGETHYIQSFGPVLSDQEIQELNAQGIGRPVLGTFTIDKKNEYKIMPVANISAEAKLETKDYGNFTIGAGYTPAMTINGAQMPSVSNLQAGWEYTFPKQPNTPTKEMLRDDRE